MNDEQDIVLAGFGGQGILLAGRLLASAAMRLGLNVLVHNYYEGFVRGGISECTVVIGSEDICSPVRDHPSVAAVLDDRAARSWSAKVRTGGLLVRNSSLAEDKTNRADVRMFDIPATEMAAELGNAMCASLIVVGALAPLVGAYTLDDCLATLSEIVPAHRKAAATFNEAALRRGADFAHANPIADSGVWRKTQQMHAGGRDGAV